MTTNTTLDARTRELVAIGASIGGNCLPCLRYHFAEARKLDCTLEEINEVIELAKTVKQRPIDDIYKLAADLVARGRESQENSQTQSQRS